MGWNEATCVILPEIRRPRKIFLLFLLTFVFLFFPPEISKLEFFFIFASFIYN